MPVHNLSYSARASKGPQRLLGSIGSDTWISESASRYCVSKLGTVAAIQAAVDSHSDGQVKDEKCPTKFGEGSRYQISSGR